MTNSPPSHMSVELTDECIKSDLVKIVNDMSKIRAENIKNKDVSDEQKDEYLHMTYRLASGMQVLDDKNITEKMRFVANRINENTSLLEYDPLQEKHWEREERKFSDALEDLLVRVMRDNFQGVDAKHHILQAVKYLGVEEADPEKRVEIYETVLPFHGAIQIKDKGIVNKTISAMFGARYKAKNLDSLTLEVSGPGENIEEVIEEAKKMGYTSIYLSLSEKDFNEAKDRIAGLELVGTVPAEKPENDKSLSPFARFANRLIKYTYPLSYPILGAMPRRIQEKLDKSLPDYSAEYASFASNWVNFLGPAALAIGKSFYENTPAYLLFAVPIIFESISRGCKMWPASGSRFSHPVGMLALKPLEYLFPRDFLDTGQAILARININDVNASRQVSDVSKFYERIAELDIPSEIEEDIRQKEGFFHTFGKKFSEYVQKNAGRGAEITENIDRANWAVVYNQKVEIDGYTRYSSLFCFNEKRYLVGFLGKGNSNDYLGRTARILSSGSENDEIITKMAEMNGARFIRIREFRDKELVSDKEAVL